jgi:hypothetical protein
MLPDVVDGFGPGGEQPVQFGQARDLRGPLLGELGQELAPDGAEEPFDLAPALRLTGQSQLILWITRCACRFLLPGSACAFESAELFFVAADFVGDGFEAAPHLLDLDGQGGQRGGVVAAGLVLVDDGTQVGSPVEGGAADLGACRDFRERDGLPGGDERGAGVFDEGCLVVVSWHWPG